MARIIVVTDESGEALAAFRSEQGMTEWAKKVGYELSPEDGVDDYGMIPIEGSENEGNYTISYGCELHE